MAVVEEAALPGLEEEGWHLIAQGAEARVYEGTYLGRACCVKERPHKLYRLPELDAALADKRAKAEARALVRCRARGLRVPALYRADFTRRRLYMQRLDGPALKLHLQSCAEADLPVIAAALGALVGELHRADVVHGDLTTSNVLFLPSESEKSPRLALIDFGLAQLDARAEDKAVDLYVLERALASAHAEHRGLWPGVMAAYRASAPPKQVTDKYLEVRARGRKRTMMG